MKGISTQMFKIVDCKDVVTCSLVDRCHRFWNTCYSRLQSRYYREEKELSVSPLQVSSKSSSP